MRAYWELAKGGYRRYTRYRTAILAALIANGAFGFIRASLLMTAITTAGTAVGGYDLQQASTYVWLGQGLLGAIPLWGVTEIAARVKSGEIAMDFLRPVAALGQWWAADLGRAASQVLPRMVPMLAVGALTTGLALPRQPLPYLLFLVSLVLAVSLAFLAWTLVNLLAMWVVEIRGYHAVFVIVMNLLTGLLVPVSWFPDWLRILADATPFPSMFQTPIDIVMGLAGPEAIGVQAVWLVVLVGTAQLMLHRGTRKLVIHGG
ncbi:MAG: ABC-2 family transporter protein [Tessaracoccus sp.]|uniref:ABC transporter permease n=1 Tax=Tessaracoccus sp. TaxID=1971211 RepID=UPI001EC84856|nr:ABC-2 family transporter protein [Tessaracoccus sp.]MBK7822575.1 ABC-2 family transporter protein [Tessaracoccus sp.]